ncbi:hypothetical protein [Chamaesiphon minutus]|uniref:Uncharacterized protein n=1 Tax=Chamaesiphon minutus (strain ATCC 27169 / PCC 6605) TaxID=1173020 RepID=K9UMJ2_CHAP6|nr:hypothetical protein [Chamaesiphon minutus]AFY95868.1 hypothetical protein Cha6605_4960 [Chamaesiphon minutus PCC 6605]
MLQMIWCLTEYLPKLTLVDASWVGEILDRLVDLDANIPKFFKNLGILRGYYLLELTS